MLCDDSSLLTMFHDQIYRSNWEYQLWCQFWNDCTVYSTCLTVVGPSSCHNSGLEAWLRIAQPQAFIPPRDRARSLFLAINIIIRSRTKWKTCFTGTRNLPHVWNQIAVCLHADWWHNQVVVFLNRQTKIWIQNAFYWRERMALGALQWHWKEINLQFSSLYSQTR